MHPRAFLTGLLGQVPAAGLERGRKRDKGRMSRSEGAACLLCTSHAACLSRFGLIEDKGSLIGCRCAALMSIALPAPSAFLFPQNRTADAHLHICHSTLCSISNLLTSPPCLSLSPGLSLSYTLTHTHSLCESHHSTRRTNV